ncbi:MAG TPA: HAD hydrolase family protein [Candidatus Saccharimonadales bacterium]|nr:HAD hydrolase family protein [Candidatus Saccharimonadales bacterium]
MATPEYILFDIDETIRGHHGADDLIDARLVGLLTVLQANGYKLGIVTGRSFAFYQEYLAELFGRQWRIQSEELFSLVIYENGHRIYLSGKHEVLVDEQSRYELDRVRKKVNALLQASDNLLSRYAALPKKTLRSQTLVTLAVREAASTIDDSTAMLQHILRELMPSNRTLRMGVVARDLITLEAVSATKAAAVSGLLGNVRMIFCCDGANDIELAALVTRLGGRVVCPQNALPALKGIASYVAGADFSVGICDYLETIVTGSDLR